MEDGHSTNIQTTTTGLLQYGMAESGRRGVMFHARNVGLPDDDIDSNQLRREIESNVERRVDWC